MSSGWRTGLGAALTPMALALATGFAHGCALTGPDGRIEATELSFSTSITVAPSRVGTTDRLLDLELRAYYEREGDTQVPIANQRITLMSATSQSQPVSLPLDIGSCLADDQRSPAGPGCPVRIVLVLWLVANGVTLDYQRLGPFPLAPGEGRALADPIAVTEIVSLDVVPSAPTITVGGTVTLAARFFTFAGDVVVRPVEWRAQSPAVASVNSAGVATGLAAGRTNITAHWGEGQSSYDARVTVTAPPTP